MIPVLAFLLGAVGIARGQGSVYFSTLVAGRVDARVTYQGAPVGDAFLGQLYAAPSGGVPTAIGFPVAFRNDAGIGYITSGGSLTVPGVPVGAPVRVKLVAWRASLGASYGAASGMGVGGVGESESITITTGATFPPTAYLEGLKGFDIGDVPLPPAVPETFALPLGSGNPESPGFLWRVHQADPGGAGTLPNSNARTENQLLGHYGANLADPVAIGAALGPGLPGSTAFDPVEFSIALFINLSQFEGEANGRFPNDRQMPGIPGLTAGTDNIAAEVLTWIELRQGTYRLVVNSDDGFQLQLGGATPADRLAPVFGRFDGGRAAADTTNDFRITQDGVYAARLTWEEGEGGANLEVFSLDSVGNAVLLNDRVNGGWPAFRAVGGFRLPGAYATSVVPIPGDSAVAFDTPIEVDLVDGADPNAKVDPASVTLTLNGNPVFPTVFKPGARTLIRYQPATRLTAGVHRVRLGFVAGTAHDHEWTFTVAPYGVLTAAMRVTPDPSRPGFHWTVFQNESAVTNSLRRAEDALAGRLIGTGGVILANRANPTARGPASGNGVLVGTNAAAPFQFILGGGINLSQTAGESNGHFPADQAMPGIPGLTGSNDGIAAEVLAWVNLPAGAITLGVNSDDGFAMDGGPVQDPAGRVRLGQFDEPSGRAAADTRFRFWVEEAGTYPIRTVWYEGVGGASLEIFSVTNGIEVLLNGPGGLRTFRPPDAVASANRPPTLASVTPLEGADEDLPLVIDYEKLQAAADEADADGDRVLFRVGNVASGLLQVNGVPVAEGISLLGPGGSWVWFPPPDRSGLVGAFSVSAWDGTATSPVPVEVRVRVDPVNDPPTLSSVAVLAGARAAQPYPVSYDALLGSADEADVDGATIWFRIENVLNGSVTKNGIAAIPGGTLLGPGETWIWTPAPEAAGDVGCFTVRAWDGSAASSTPVEVKAATEGRNLPPVLGFIPDQRTPAGVEVTVPLSVSDADTPSSDLSPGWSTTRPDLLRNVVWGTTLEGNWVARLIPSRTGSGVASVTLWFGDGVSLASRTLRLLVRQSPPPALRIVEDPLPIVAAPGEAAALSVLADGPDPISYVWRRNGVVLPNQTGPDLFFPSLRPEDGGTYSVVVYNGVGILESDRVTVRVPVQTVGNLADHWPPREVVTAVEGYLQISNTNATRQTGEPDHAGKPGGRSVWFTWKPPTTGIATLATLGSTFDTLLAVYRDDPLAAGSRAIAFNEDGDELGDHYFNSAVRFNARAGETYFVAVDGFYGAVGEITLGLVVRSTPRLVPVIARQPESVAVVPGTRGIPFSVEVDPSSGDNVVYRWFRNRVPLANASRTNVWFVESATADNVGAYHVEVFNGFETTRSATAFFELTTVTRPRTDFEATDLWAPASLAWKLRSRASPVADAAAGWLSSGTRQALAVWPVSSELPSSIQGSIARDLSAMIQGPSIHDSKTFAGVDLRSETRRYLDRASRLGAADRARLNRLLLEDAFPFEIARRREEGVVTRDKFEDAWVRGTPTGNGALHRAGLADTGSGSGAAVPVFPGVPGSQLLSNEGSSTQLGEGVDCLLRYDRTRWIGVTLEEAGTLVVDTFGSEVATLAALYDTNTPPLIGNIWNPTACGGSAAPGVTWSRLAVPLSKGTYYLQIDGVDEQVGLIQVDWLLLTRGPDGLEPHLGAHPLLTSIRARRDDPTTGATASYRTNAYALRFTSDPAGGRSWKSISQIETAVGAASTWAPVVPSVSVDWLSILLPDNGATGGRFFRIE